MILSETDVQFIAFSIKRFSDIFQTFQSLLFFSSNCNLFSSMSGDNQIFVFQKSNVSTDFICQRCSVCWTICVFINVFLSGHFLRFFFSSLRTIA